MNQDRTTAPNATGHGPLSGLRVLEIASMAPGPFACTVLADLGAEVLRVDRASDVDPDTLASVDPLARGRRSLAVDLKQPEGAALVRRLAARADVLVEGFRPGVAERLGIGPEDCRAVNPRLVYGRMTGWGQSGPLAPRAGHDITYLAVSGALGLIGPPDRPPVPPVNLVGDFGGGGLLLAFGILAALYERERSGLGQVVDAAMVDGAALLTTALHGLRTAGQWEGERGENLLDGGAPFYTTYETADGRYVAVGPLEERFYAQLLAGLGLAGDPELPGQYDRERWPELRQRLAAAFKERTRDEWTAIFEPTDACVAPVLSPWEAHLHPHNAARTVFAETGGTRQPAPAPRFDRTPGRIQGPSPVVGQDSRGALADWGFDASEAARLLGAAVVVQHPHTGENR
ncbi:CaiB/BaiF CoA transferase family protein [Streptomyces fuscichromogenes]|uniref:CoA transferase n=1 Tax=Streptomyces fuscichromogenes TaxID=1324013 RepID=A0A917XFH7_9ACTN|nr:CaiB/BaiF CoA-transferase family protein [Streptomyces fuscichromogenes]GGN19285.1 CoA transferase [Streptomyces fuscichromogenes]